MESKQSPAAQQLSGSSVQRSKTDDAHNVDEDGASGQIASLCPEDNCSCTPFSTMTAASGTSPTAFDGEEQSSRKMVLQLQSHTAPSPFCGTEISAPSSFGGTKSRATLPPPVDENKPSLPRTQSMQPMRSTLLTPRCLKGGGDILTTGQTIRPFLRMMRSTTGATILYDNFFDAVSGTPFGTEPPPTITSRGDESDTADETQRAEGGDIDFGRHSLRESGCSAHSEGVGRQRTRWLQQYRMLLLIAAVLSAATGSLWTVVDWASMSTPPLLLFFVCFLLTVFWVTRTLWVVAALALSTATRRRRESAQCQRLIFCVDGSGHCIYWSLLALSANALLLFLKHCPDRHHFARLVAATWPSVLDGATRSLHCALVLSSSLFLKTLLIRWVALKYYLATNLEKIKNMVRYEKWLQILLRRRHIFSMKTKQFLDLNAMRNVATTTLRLDVLLFQEQFNLESDAKDEAMAQQLVNTLTSSAFFKNCSQRADALNVHTMALWAYSAKTQTARVIDDNELEKICKLFAKFVVLSVTEKRTVGDHEHRDTLKPPKPTFAEIKNLFAAHSSGSSGDPPSVSPPKCTQSQSTSPSPSFIRKHEFLECFSKVDQNEMGQVAWAEMNVSEEQLTRKELQRWLYQYLHSLVFQKQALSSYPELLTNLDVSSSVAIVFVMFLVFLLIFGVKFTDSIATYASTVAIFAVFGRNVFTQFFDSVYLIFVLCPFEVGDTVLIDGARFTVNKMHIMSTEMISAVSAGNTVVTKCNSRLLGKDVVNLSRTTNPYHNVTLFVSQNTTTRQLNELKTRIDRCIRTKLKSDILDTWFVLEGVDEECRMKISLFLGSVYSFSDSNAMWRQIHILNKEIRDLVDAMGIQYRRRCQQDVELSFADGQRPPNHGALSAAAATDCRPPVIAKREDERNGIDS